jgi:hypothetical protein
MTSARKIQSARNATHHVLLARIPFPDRESVGRFPARPEKMKTPNEPTMSMKTNKTLRNLNRIRTQSEARLNPIEPKMNPIEPKRTQADLSRPVRQRPLAMLPCPLLLSVGMADPFVLGSKRV